MNDPSKDLQGRFRSNVDRAIAPFTLSTHDPLTLSHHLAIHSTHALLHAFVLLDSRTKRGTCSRTCHDAPDT